jgi:hypothetical protein
VNLRQIANRIRLVIPNAAHDSDGQLVIEVGLSKISGAFATKEAGHVSLSSKPF